MFATGEIATGQQFIGREAELVHLSNIFKTAVSMHLVGAPRIGKSSLIEKVFTANENRNDLIPIRMDMSTFENAFDFWDVFCKEIAYGIENLGEEIKQSDALLDLDPNNPNWYSRMRFPLMKTLESLKRKGIRIVISIDEFDAVTRVFEGKSHYYQMLRSLLSEGRYAINGVIVSRRNLEVLEAKAEDISTFHGVFDTLRLKAFNSTELDSFYSYIEAEAIPFEAEAKEQFEFFTGGIPYLCCMLANQALKTTDSSSVSVDQIIEAHKECQPQVWRYYNDLIARLKEDGHLEPLIYLAFDEMRTLSYADNRNNMIAMGYLNEVDDGQGGMSYYAYSKGFMSYLRLKPLDADTWTLLSASEKKLKGIFGKAYPKFVEVTYKDVNGPNANSVKEQISKTHEEADFEWTSQTDWYLKSATGYLKNPSVLDILPITFVIGRITRNWAKTFSHFFGDDASWRQKLKLIGEVRNPVAHMHESSIDEEKMSRCKRYMKELIDL